jgi:glyoxylase-like metal-dependent hydrolase (beta-lactamase superfamily II)
MGLKTNLNAEIVAPDEDFHVAAFDYTSATDGSLYQFSTGGPEIKALHTPGHTPGSTCYLIDNQYIITGDTVFIYSIGRPDLGGMAQEWSKMLFATMTQKIMQWDNTIVALPGHYMDWKEANQELSFAETMEQIKAINTAIYSIADEDAFYAFIKSNMRKQPDEYAKIREINAGLVTVDDEDADIMDLGKNECAASQMAK